MRRKELKRLVYKIFSDKLMALLAIFALVIFVFEYSITIPWILQILVALDAIIWLAFVFEFVLKVYVEENKTLYIRSHKLDSGVSIVIIFAPIIALFVNSFFAFSPILRIIRTVRILRGLPLVRGAAYAAKAGLKSAKNFRDGL